MNINIGDLKILQIKMINKVKTSAIPMKIKAVIIDEIYKIQMPLSVYYKKNDMIISAEFKGKIVAKVYSRLNELKLNPIQIDKILDVIRKANLI